MGIVLKTLIVKLGSMVINYLPHIGFSLAMDVLDEIVLTLLEKQIAKDKSKQNARRVEIYKKYWEGFKTYRERTNYKGNVI